MPVPPRGAGQTGCGRRGCRSAAWHYPRQKQHAKKFGIQTGEAIWQAQRKCLKLVLFPPDFPMYLYFSKRARQIYADYTDQVEPFGLDECWLDVSESIGLFGSGATIAQEISNRIKTELGVNVSIGVLWNKIFAKLGSDYKKPDAITVFHHGNYRDLIWPPPVGDLLYVGSSTKRKLRNMAIFTTGDLAQVNLRYTRSALGKMADILYGFANGLDITPVAHIEDTSPIKSIGNSCTASHDFRSEEDAKMLLTALTVQYSGSIHRRPIAPKMGADRQNRGLAARTVRQQLYPAGRCAARQGDSWDRCQSRPYHSSGWLFLTQEVESMQKVLVGVTTEWTTDGKIIPMLIRWEDGRKFAVDQVLDVRQAASLKVDGAGIRYTIRILGRKHFCFARSIGGLWKQHKQCTIYYFWASIDTAKIFIICYLKSGVRTIIVIDSSAASYSFMNIK